MIGFYLITNGTYSHFILIGFRMFLTFRTAMTSGLI
jgi:hypothetical protein